MNHTPGPWRRERNHVVVRNKDGDLQYDVISMSNTKYRELGQEAVANMKLIAAAPDMLAALGVVKDYLLYGEVHYSKIDAYKAVCEAVSLAIIG